MDTDDEDEDIESETEEDSAFLDDEEIEERGVSFYNALDRKPKDRSDDNQGNVDKSLNTTAHKLRRQKSTP